MAEEPFLEKRRHKRVSVSLPIAIGIPDSDIWVRGQTVNISQQGALMEANIEPTQRDQILGWISQFKGKLLEIRVTHEGKEIIRRGELRHSHWAESDPSLLRLGSWIKSVKVTKRKNPMKDLEKRMRDLEELVFQVVLQTKAESMAIREILLEKDLVSSDGWEARINHHKMSYGYFEMIQEIEGGHRRSKSAIEPPWVVDEKKDVSE
jgi:hypothetical protein